MGDVFGITLGHKGRCDLQDCSVVHCRKQLALARAGHLCVIGVGGSYYTHSTVVSRPTRRIALRCGTVSLTDDAMVLFWSFSYSIPV
jgi:hypothetical protein